MNNIYNNSDYIRKSNEEMRNSNSKSNYKSENEKMFEQIDKDLEDLLK